SATSASRSPWLRPSTPSRRAARPSGSTSTTNRSSRSSIPSARPSRHRSTTDARRQATASATTLAQMSSARSTFGRASSRKPWPADDARPNVVRTIVIRHGDPDAQAEVSISGVYELGIQDQAFLGPESGLAVPDAEGGVENREPGFRAEEGLDLDPE